MNIFPIGSYVKTMSADGGHLGWTTGPTGLIDTILKGDHPRTIPSKFGPNWPSSFRQRRFFIVFPIRSADGGHLGWTSGPTDTILKGDHPRNIASKFGRNRPSSFRRRRFFIVFPIGSYVKTMSADGGHLGWTSGPTNTFLKGDHPRNIPSKFGPNWPSSFR